MNDYITNEFMRLIKGDAIGEGAHRKVFQHRQNVDWVVKVEEGAKSFANAIEWDTWVHANPGLRKWLCPCIDISPSGAVLIMQKADPIRERELPKKLPALFTDLKISNWGVIDDKPVCIDYGWQRMNSNTKLEKACWG
jgi:hypothetical protein